jgi:hypothetical protein
MHTLLVPAVPSSMTMIGRSRSDLPADPQQVLCRAFPNEGSLSAGAPAERVQLTPASPWPLPPLIAKTAGLGSSRPLVTAHFKSSTLLPVMVKCHAFRRAAEALPGRSPWIRFVKHTMPDKLQPGTRSTRQLVEKAFQFRCDRPGWNGFDVLGAEVLRSKNAQWVNVARPTARMRGPKQNHLRDIRDRKHMCQTAIIHQRGR